MDAEVADLPRNRCTTLSLCVDERDQSVGGRVLAVQSLLELVEGLEPRIFQELRRRWSPRLVHRKYPLHQIFGTNRHISKVILLVCEYRWPPVFACRNFAEQVVFVSRMERHLAGQQDVQNHAECPHVRRAAEVLLLLGHFWAHVNWRATGKRQLRIRNRLHRRREAEVNQLRLLGLPIDEDVLKLEIAMDHSLLVHILH